VAGREDSLLSDRMDVVQCPCKSKKEKRLALYQKAEEQIISLRFH